MSRAIMPKAAVNKNGNFILGKNKIGFAKSGKIPPPTGDSFTAQNFNKQ